MNNNIKKVAVVMGSDSDLPILKPCFEHLKKFGIEFEARIISAHRTPFEAEKFAKSAEDEENNFGVIIAAAGKAAHLAGVLAANCTLPVIGVPISSKTLDGLDSLLSTVQMPAGIPVATVAIDGAANAAILAAQILAGQGNNQELKNKLKDFKREMAETVKQKDKAVNAKIIEMLC